MRFSPGRYSPDNTVTTGIASAADDTRHTLKVRRMYEAIKRSCKHHTIVYKDSSIYRFGHSSEFHSERQLSLGPMAKDDIKEPPIHTYCDTILKVDNNKL